MDDEGTQGSNSEKKEMNFSKNSEFNQSSPFDSRTLPEECDSQYIQDVLGDLNSTLNQRFQEENTPSENQYPDLNLGRTSNSLDTSLLAGSTNPSSKRSPLKQLNFKNIQPVNEELSKEVSEDQNFLKKYGNKDHFTPQENLNAGFLNSLPERNINHISIEKTPVNKVARVVQPRSSLSTGQQSAKESAKKISSKATSNNFARPETPASRNSLNVARTSGNRKACAKKLLFDEPVEESEKDLSESDLTSSNPNDPTFEPSEIIEIDLKNAKELSDKLKENLKKKNGKSKQNLKVLKKVSEGNNKSNTKKAVCVYCKKEVSKLPRHLEDKHYKEEDVKNIMKLPQGKKKIIS